MITSRYGRTLVAALMAGGFIHSLLAAPAADEVELPKLDVTENASGDVTARQQVEAEYRASKTETVVAADTVLGFNSSNNYDALRLVPGVSYLWEAGGRQGKPSRIRGAATWAIADVIDGYPAIREAGIGAEDGGLTADLGAAIPAIALESITVAKGALGVLYAADADGGVIVNEIKRGRPGGPRGSVWLEYSPIAEQLLMADVGGGSEDGRWDYYAAGKVLDGDYDKVTTQGGNALEEDRFYSGITKLGWQPDDATRVELLGLAARDRIHYTRNFGSGERFRTVNTMEFLGVTLDRRLSAAWSFDLGGSLWRNEAERYSLDQQAAARDRPEHAETLFANLYFDGELAADIAWSAAAGIEHVEHNQQEEANNSDKEHDFRDSSLYYFNSLTFGGNKRINAGVRFVDTADDFTDDSLVVYDVGAAWTLPSATTLRASYSTGYSRNKGFVFFFGPIERAGGVEISESATAEIGLEQQFIHAGKIRGDVELTLFQTRTDNVPNFSGGSAGAVYYDVHKVKGVELAASWQLTSSLSLLGSYTWLDTEIVDATNPSGGGIGGTSVPVPRHAGGLGLEWQPAPRWRLSTLATYNDGSRAEALDSQTREVTVTTRADYVRWNAALFYDATADLTLFVRAENLLDEADLGYTQEVSGPGGVSATELDAEDPGRFLVVGLNYEW